MTVEEEAENCVERGQPVDDEEEEGYCTECFLVIVVGGL